MDNRLWRRLFLSAVVLLALSPLAPAQNPRSSNQSAPPPSKQSHYDLPGGLDLDNPQEMMVARLRELHELHQLQDQVQDWLNDPEFRKRIEPQLRQLHEKLLRGERLSEDRDLKEVLRQKLSERQIESFLRSLAKHAEHKQMPQSEQGLLNRPTNDAPTSPSVSTPGSPITPPSLPPAKPPEPSLLDRMQQETTQWMMEHLDDVGGDVLEALTEAGATQEGAPLAELLRSLQQPDFSGMNLSEKVLGLSRYLPKASEFLHEQRGAWNEVRSLFRDVPAPPLPRFGGSSISLPSAPAAGSDSGAPAVLSLLLLGMIVLLLCRMAARAQGRTNSREGEWRLGPWPVAPDGVSTREEVIHAFEYLALLRLGAAAGACHHRELAERLAQQDSGNPARRQAAEMLAWLYEQARYAPAGESLSQEELTEARHALCFLAGVTAS